ncbi:TIGR02099 family protein [Pseudomaricurvus alcaniphilus]|uniref:YhdP family protein n=1 Tax=Pseudomaricurvus alcaniphilus TaxID=1166482 RepID=UPI00140E8561|nr:YhdP family protein [Pseudomaricurvus alcaniphilus]NHN39676.1 TIGR02099 family protein [Pseudomaricurvus alcaniphilus]
MIRHLKLGLRLFWGALATLLIGLALLIELGRQMLPQISQWREDVEFYLSRQVGQAVAVGHISASWKGLSPELSFEDLVITVDADTKVLQVGRAVAKLDLLRSLWEMNWRLQRLEVDAVDAILVQAEDGRWSLAGFKAADRSKPFQLDPLELLLLSSFVQFDDIKLAFHLRSGRETNLDLTSLLLQNDSRFHRLTAELDLPEQADALRFVYEGRGLPGRKGFSGQGYLALDDFPLVGSVALASEEVAAFEGVRDGRLSTRLWMQAAYDQAVTFTGTVGFARQQPQEGSLPGAVSAAMNGRWHPQAGWSLGLQQVQVDWQPHQSEPFDMLVQGQFGLPDITLQASRLDLGYWLERLRQSPIAGEKLQGILAELNVRGELAKVHVSLPLAAPADFKLRANLRQGAVNDWKGAPQVEGLDGYVEASARAGKVQIYSRDVFLMHFPLIYRLPFQFSSASGEVGWQILPDSNQVLVNSGLLSMQGDLGSIHGYFYLDAPLQRNSRLSELILQLGLTSGKAIDRGQLMPFLVPDNVESWVNQAVIKGALPSAGFVLQGYVGKREEEEPRKPMAIQLAMNVDNASLAFHPDWPELVDFSGFLQMDAPVVEGWIDSGEFLGTQLAATSVVVAQNPRGEGPLLQVRGAASGAAAAGLQVLTGTPLRQQVGPVFDDWQVVGDIKAELELDIPLAAEQPGHRQKVHVELDNAALELAPVNLTFTEINGSLAYTSAQGLVSEQLTGSLWGEVLEAEIQSVAAGKRTTDVKFKGNLNFADLAAWSRRPEILFLEGRAAVSGAISLSGDKAQLRAGTDLRGVAIDLPAPFGKSKNDRRPLNIDLPIDSDGFSLHLDYNQQLFANLDIPRDETLYGTISLGQAMASRSGGIWVTGSLPLLNGSEWLPVLERYGQLGEQLQPLRESAAAPTEQAKPGPLLHLDASVGVFKWGDLELPKTLFGGGQVDDGWSIRLANDKVAGKLRLYNDQRVPEIDLDYLRWQLADADGATPPPEGATRRDPLADIDPSELQALKIRVQELRVNAEEYGQWSLNLRPMEGGLLVSDIQGVIRHVAVGGADVTLQGQGPAGAGQAKQKGAELFWQKTAAGEATTFKGVLRGRNLVDVTDAWQLPRLLESKSINMDAALNWQGSPAMFAVNTLQGDLQLDIRDGRFYQSTGQASSAFLRLVGLFNFDSWTRRLQLDFSDVYKGGMPFEKIDGKMRFAEGIMHLTQPIEVSNTSSKMQMGGRINLVDETLDTSLVATLPVGGNATFLTALIAGLPAAAGVYLASKIFEKQMDKVASLSYRMEGPWSDPKISFDKLFDNKAAEKASKESRTDSDAAESGAP